MSWSFSVYFCLVHFLHLFVFVVAMSLTDEQTHDLRKQNRWIPRRGLNLDSNSWVSSKLDRKLRHELMRKVAYPQVVFQRQVVRKTCSTWDLDIIWFTYTSGIVCSTLFFVCVSHLLILVWSFLVTALFSPTTATLFPHGRYQLEDPSGCRKGSWMDCWLCFHVWWWCIR